MKKRKKKKYSSVWSSGLGLRLRLNEEEWFGFSDGSSLIVGMCGMGKNTLENGVTKNTEGLTGGDPRTSWPQFRSVIIFHCMQSLAAAT
jgi:hypothetical protein